MDLKSIMVIKSIMVKLISTGAFLNTIVEGLLVMLIGGALFIFSYLVLADVIASVGTVSNTNINTSMYSGMSQVLQGLGLMGIVFIVVGLIVVIRAFLSIYGGGQTGRGAI
jgi:hypothetical protein